MGTVRGRRSSFTRLERRHARPRPGGRLRRSAGGAFVVGATITSLVAGVAFAAWLANGSGTGYAKVKQKQALVTESATASDTLYPGAVGDLTFRVHNPNPYPLVITSVSLDPARQISPSDCAITFTDQTGLSLPIGAGARETYTLAGSVAMGLDAADSCAGQTIAIPITMAGSTPQPATPTASQVVETYSTPASSRNFSAGAGAGQTFTRPNGVTKLTRIDVYVTSASTGSGPTDHSTIVSVWPGAPGIGTALFSQTYANTAFPAGEWKRFDLSTAVDVPSSFSVTLQQPSINNDIRGFHNIGESTANPYAGGHASWQNGALTNSWTAQTGTDLQLRLFGF